MTPLSRQLKEPANYSPQIQQSRLRILIAFLQSPSNFSLTSGSYPLACQWTSTVIATLLIDYMHLTSDDSYFPHLLQFYKHQPTWHLTTQKYDDKAWVVLTYLRAITYLTKLSNDLRLPMHKLGDSNYQWYQKFLSRIRWFYKLVKPGWDDKYFGGGMWWGPLTWYKNAVTTELFVDCAAGIYELFGDRRDLERAIRAWIWFKECGMINEEGLVNDGLTSNFKNNRQTTWTYNQGIILSGLSKLYKHTGDPQLLHSAISLVDAVISSALVPNNNGILVESRDPSGTCDQDQRMFKGVFFQHLGWFLEDIANLKRILQRYSPFIHANANAVWSSRSQDGTISSWWDTPSGKEDGPGLRQASVETLGSGISAIMSAVRVDELMRKLESLTENGRK